ncbi:hypothetical protein BDV19DRAFT_386259 [Aspergillus venezuelensis]
MYSVHSRKNGTIKRLVFKCPHCDGEDPTECIAKRHYVMCERCGKDYSPQVYEKCNWCKDWPVSCDHEGSMKWLEDNSEIPGGKPTEASKGDANAGAASSSAAKGTGEDIADSASKDDHKDKEKADS